MSQVEHRAERSFAIKGTLVFTAQRDQFTIMEDAYLVCDGKKVAGTYSALPEQYRQIKVLDASGKFVIPGTCDIHVHASQAPFQGIGQNIENGQWNTWFDRYAFPDESRFNDPAYAELTYTRFAKSLLATPTTRLCAYATTSRDGDRDSHESSGKVRLCRLRWESQYGSKLCSWTVGNNRGNNCTDPPLAGGNERWYWCNLSDSHAAIFSQLYGKLSAAVGTACRRIPCPSTVTPFGGTG